MAKNCVPKSSSTWADTTGRERLCKKCLMPSFRNRRTLESTRELRRGHFGVRCQAERDTALGTRIRISTPWADCPSAPARNPLRWRRAAPLPARTPRRSACLKASAQFFKVGITQRARMTQSHFFLNLCIRSVLCVRLSPTYFTVSEIRLMPSTGRWVLSLHIHGWLRGIRGAGNRFAHRRSRSSGRRWPRSARMTRGWRKTRCALSRGSARGAHLR